MICIVFNGDHETTSKYTGSRNGYEIPGNFKNTPHSMLRIISGDGASLRATRVPTCTANRLSMTMTRCNWYWIKKCDGCYLIATMPSCRQNAYRWKLWWMRYSCPTPHVVHVHNHPRQRWFDSSTVRVSRAWPIQWWLLNPGYWFKYGSNISSMLNISPR